MSALRPIRRPALVGATIALLACVLAVEAILVALCFMNIQIVDWDPGGRSWRLPDPFFGPESVNHAAVALSLRILKASLLPAAVVGAILGLEIERSIASSAGSKAWSGWLGAGMSLAALESVALGMALGYAPWGEPGFWLAILSSVWRPITYGAPIVALAGAITGRQVWLRLR